MSFNLPTGGCCCNLDVRSLNGKFELHGDGWWLVWCHLPGCVTWHVTDSCCQSITFPRSIVQAGTCRCWVSMPAVTDSIPATSIRLSADLASLQLPSRFPTSREILFTALRAICRTEMPKSVWSGHHDYCGTKQLLDKDNDWVAYDSQAQSGNRSGLTCVA
jgi:hypothetical protein